LQTEFDTYIKQPDVFKQGGFAYRIDAEKWAGSTIRDSASDSTIDVPPVKENETIDEYIKRIDGLKVQDADTEKGLSIFTGSYQ